MKNSSFVIVLVSFLAVACSSHSTMRGSVAMKVSEREAHVCLGKGEVKEGDEVTAYYNDCQDIVAGGRDGGSYGVPCVKKKLGYGKVVKTLNEHYSVVEFEEGLRIQEGTFVEKQR